MTTLTLSPDEKLIIAYDFLNTRDWPGLESYLKTITPKPYILQCPECKVPLAFAEMLKHMKLVHQKDNKWILNNLSAIS